MAKRVQYPGEMRRAFFAEWRLHKGWTQDELLQRLSGMGVEMSVASLSRYESGDQPYSQDVLYSLSDAYGCEPEDLSTVNPLTPKDMPSLTYDALKDAPADIQEQAYRYVTEFLMKRAG